jgi:hypothetical protein
MRVFPVILFIFIFFLVFNTYGIKDSFRWFYLAFGFLPCIILWSNKIITQLSIGKYGVNASFIRFVHQSSRDISWSEVDHIQLRVRHGKNGGAFYKLVFNDGTKFQILKIPVFYLNNESVEQIDKFLQTISGKSLIKKKGIF